jgi:hypothetical protein
MIRLELTQIITSGYDADSFIGVQPAAFGTKGGENSGMGPYQQILPLGYYARPLDRTADGVGCWAICGTEGSKGYAWTIQDPRYADKCPPLTKGSNAIVNCAGAFMLLDYEAETGTILVPYDSGTKEHVITIGKDANGKSTIELRHGDGSYLSITGDGSILRGTGGGFLNVNGGNIDANGNLNCTGAGSFGHALPVNALVPFLGFQAFLTALETALQPLVTPTPGAPLGTAIAAAIATALTSTTAALKTQYLTAL